MSISAYRGETFEASGQLIIVGARAAGLCAALAAKEAGLEPLVLERHPHDRCDNRSMIISLSPIRSPSNSIHGVLPFSPCAYDPQ
jgi:thioredoxin reductase